ncbi:MAG: hypothetical protein M1434_09890 [Chloroflexi bacterium]|nr:hypothetical protein [Chloroflexota bacterium]MCL5275035.1 hypothetical protein [Chloroflexota bacterium]
MNNVKARPRSIALKGSPQLRVYRSFEDWEAEQRLDLRTPEQRGIGVGSPVMWRHRNGRIIITERAIVTAVHNNELTLQVKDVETRICSADVGEIVSNQFGHLSLTEANRRAFLANQMEPVVPTGVNYASDEPPTPTSWL